MQAHSYACTSKVWLYPGAAAWHFISVPKKESAEIKSTHGSRSKGFGSIPVRVTIGTTTWKTSLFPDKQSGTYLLPLKAQVRKKEGIEEGDNVKFSIIL